MTTQTDDDDVQDVPAVADGTDATGPLDTMTKEGMNKACGREALFMFGVMFPAHQQDLRRGSVLRPKVFDPVSQGKRQENYILQKPGSSQHRVFSLESSVVHDVFSP